MDSEAKKEFALARGAWIFGFCTGAFIGAVVTFGITISIMIDTKIDARMWQNFRADGLNNGSLEYTYDKDGHPQIRWKNGGEIDSTTTRSAQPKSENAQSK